MKPFVDVVTELTPIYREKSRKTWQDFDGATRLHLVPFFGPKPINQVGAFWRHYCAFQKNRNPDRKLWHDRKTLRVILGYAFDCEYIEKIPRLPLDPIHLSRRVGKEVTREELETAMAHASPQWRDLLFVLWSTGMRFSEARCLTVSQVDFKTGLVRIPAQNTKTRRERVYYLPADALMVLQKRKNRGKGPFLFPSLCCPSKPMSESHRSFERMKKRAGLDFNIHDLRHSFVTRKVREGMPIDLLGKLIGASSAVMNSVYLHPKAEDWIRFK